MGSARSDQAPSDRLVAQETLIADAQELLVGLLEHDIVSRSDLARRLGKSKAFVTQLLSGERNFTLRTLADCAHALGYHVVLGVAPVQGHNDEPCPRCGGLHGASTACAYCGGEKASACQAGCAACGALMVGDDDLDAEGQQEAPSDGR